MALLRDLVTQRGLALLMITHNPGVVRETANHVCVMSMGRMLERGETAAIFDALQFDYIRALIAAVPRLTVGTRYGTVMP